MGGEPLLHPQFNDFVSISRKYFEKSVIKLITNGILLINKSDDFFKFLKDHNIFLVLSQYPINIDYQRLHDRAIENGVETGELEKSVDWWEFKFSPFPMSKSKTIRNFVTCYQNNGSCHALVDGKFYPCTEAARWQFLQNHTGSIFPNMGEMGIDIHQAPNLDAILDHISKPVELCKYCGANNLKKSQWGHSSRKASEWIIDEKNIKFPKKVSSKKFTLMQNKPVP